LLVKRFFLVWKVFILTTQDDFRDNLARFVWKECKGQKQEVTMSTWSDTYISANDISLHYYRTGGDKPPIVLLHGFTDSALCWTRVARILEPDYDVIMLDTRGHGLSEGPTTGFSTQLLADDTSSFIQALGLKQPFLLGHSMGAGTAAVVAAQHPDLVRAILLEDPPWPARIAPSLNDKGENQLQEPASHPWYKWVAPLKAQTSEERLQAARINNPTWAAEEQVPWADAKAQFNLNVFRYNTSPISWREIVSNILCPILLITSDPEKGAIVTPEVALEASHLWKDGQIIHIDGAGHNIRREQFEQYKDVVTTFLKEH
jgi:N-formylmaleamate deformylase